MKFESLLFSALSSPLGIEVTTSDPSGLRQRLYAARRKDMATFSDLAFIIPPVNSSSTLWIIRKTPDGATEAQ